MSHEPFDIDMLIETAKHDPEKLQQILDENVELLISSAPESSQKRLRGLQFQIDCERRKHKTAMGACMGITTMMFDSLNKLNHILHGEHEKIDDDRETEPAKVINLFNNQ